MRYAKLHYSNGKSAGVRFDSIALILLLSHVVWPAVADEISSAPDAGAISAADALGAIQLAQVAVDEARALGSLWLGTGGLLAKASAFEKTGEHARAIAVADRARSQAVTALNQHRLEKARYLYGKLKADRPDATDDLRTISGMLQAYDGEAALRLVRELSNDR